MFIRFFGSRINHRSQVPEGLFWTASDLSWSDELPDYELEAITELRNWFNKNMDSPFDYLSRHRRHERAVCWFKSTAHEHIARAWELVAILERNDVLIWTIKSARAGYVHYEDDIQVFARPYDDVRLLM